MKVFDLSKMQGLGSSHNGSFQFTRKGYAKFFGAIQHSLDAPFSEARGMQKRFRELATTGQFPAQVAQMFEKFKVGRGDVDLSWLTVFDTVDLNNTSAPSYALADIQNGVSFKKVLAGEKARIYSLTGAETSIGFDQYGAGLEIPGVWYEDQRWWDIADNVQDYQLAWWEDLATVMFALIEAVPDGFYDGTTTGVDAGEGCNIDYAAAHSNTLQDDIEVINAGVVSLLNGLKTAGMRVNAATPLVLIHNIARAGRVRAALEQRRSTVYAGPEVLVPNIQAVTTLGLTTTAEWTGFEALDTVDELPLGYLAVPGRKSKYINRKSLKIYPPEFNTENYATKVMAWGRYGGVLNALQIRRLLASADA